MDFPPVGVKVFRSRCTNELLSIGQSSTGEILGFFGFRFFFVLGSIKGETIEVKVISISESSY